MKNMFDPLEGGGGGKLASADFSGPTTSRLRATLNRWCLSFWNLISRHRLVLERETFRRRRSCFSFPRSRTQVSLEPSDSDKFRFETSKSRWKATYLLHYFQNFISASSSRKWESLVDSSLIRYDSHRVQYARNELEVVRKMVEIEIRYSFTEGERKAIIRISFTWNLCSFVGGMRYLRENGSTILGASSDHFEDICRIVGQTATHLAVD